MVCDDTSRTLSAFATQYPGSLSLGTCSTLDYLYRPLFHPRLLRYKVLQQASPSFPCMSVAF